MPFLHLSSAFGLSSAAGLNAYIPLLLVSILARTGHLTLHAPYDVMSSWWCIIVLAVLCLIELIVDKIPGIDHINDIIQTFIRPTSAAILFASQAGVISHVHPSVWIVIGLLTGGAVHAAKATARPVINLTTCGIGAPVVSTLENLVSTVLTILAILAPVICLVVLVIFAWIMIKAYRRFLGRKRPIRVAAVPVEIAADAPLAGAGDKSTWAGGV